MLPLAVQAGAFWAVGYLVRCDMKYRRPLGISPLSWSLFGALALAVTAGVLFYCSRSPKFDGRPLASWVSDLSHPDRNSNRKAHDFFSKHGKQTVPDLIKLIKQSKPAASKKPLSPFTQVFPAALINRLEMHQFERANAIYACSLIGPEARSAAPTVLLFGKDNDPKVRSRVARALGEIQAAPSSSVPELTKMLQDPDAGVRNNAARSLGLFGTAAVSALPELTKAVNDPDPLVVGVARFAIKMISTPEKVVKSDTNQFRTTE